MDIGSLAITLLGQMVIASVATWVTTRLALRRFYSEKLWERKAASYTEIFQALHDMHRNSSNRLDELEGGRTITDEQKDSLSKEYHEAKIRLERRLDAEIWLLPIPCRERVIRMRRELESDSAMSLHQAVEDDFVAIKSALEDLRGLARVDLQLDFKRFRPIINMFRISAIQRVPELTSSRKST